MLKKLYYITTEITPFANPTGLGDFSVHVPLRLQEKGHDIRTIIPKYGYVSERKYILREVIRLREIPFEFLGENQVASAKSAFIPKTRVQIYFLEDEKWFKPLTNLVYKSKNGRVLADNTIRYGFFSKAVLSTLPHLFWTPHIFLCNGWQSAMLPGLYKKHFEGSNKFYKKIKTILLIHENDEFSQVERSDLDLMKIPIDPSLKGNKLNAYEVAAFNANAVVIFNRPSSPISTKLMKLPGLTKNKKKISVLDLKDDENPDYDSIVEDLNTIIKKTP